MKLQIRNKYRQVVAEVLVDSDIYHRFKNMGLHLVNNRYAGITLNRRTYLLHRIIVNAPEGAIVDHIDRDPMNCTRENLRLVGWAENGMNKSLSVANTTGYTGVSFHRATQKFQAYICKSRKVYALGVYPTPEEAAYVRDAAARELHGEFAVLNFPDHAPVWAEEVAKSRLWNT